MLVCFIFSLLLSIFTSIFMLADGRTNRQATISGGIQSNALDYMLLLLLLLVGGWGIIYLLLPPWMVLFVVCVYYPNCTAAVAPTNSTTTTHHILSHPPIREEIKERPRNSRPAHRSIPPLGVTRHDTTSRIKFWSLIATNTEGDGSCYLVFTSLLGQVQDHGCNTQIRRKHQYNFMVSYLIKNINLLSFPKAKAKSITLVYEWTSEAVEFPVNNVSYKFKTNANPPSSILLFSKSNDEYATLVLPRPT